MRKLILTFAMTAIAGSAFAGGKAVECDETCIKVRAMVIIMREDMAAREAAQKDRWTYCAKRWPVAMRDEWRACLELTTKYRDDEAVKRRAALKRTRGEF